MWQAINEEREESSNIRHIKERCVYSLINEVLHVTTDMLLPIVASLSGVSPTVFLGSHLLHHGGRAWSHSSGTHGISDLDTR